MFNPHQTSISSLLDNSVAWPIRRPSVRNGNAGDQSVRGSQNNLGGGGGGGSSVGAPQPVHPFFQASGGGKVSGLRRKRSSMVNGVGAGDENTPVPVSIQSFLASGKNFKERETASATAFIDSVEEAKKAAAFETLMRSDYLHLIASANNHTITRVRMNLEKYIHGLASNPYQLDIWEERRHLIELLDTDEIPLVKKVQRTKP